MPRYSDFPTTFDNVLQLSITKLKEWGYLKPGQTNSGTVNWSSQGNPTGSVSILVTTEIETATIIFDYRYCGEPRRYSINIVSTPSNLNKGHIWYFLCPKTNKRCRKLYSLAGYFLHREAFSRCYYESQIQSKYYRELGKSVAPEFELDHLYSEIFKKHFKRLYKGQRTHKYLRLLKLIQKFERRPLQQIEADLLEE
jgi:hypothetical protein